MPLDTKKLTQQANKIHDVLQWIKKVNLLKQRIKRLESGIDTDLYNIKRQQTKLDYLLQNKEMEKYMSIVDTFSERKQLEDDMRKHTSISFDTKRSESERQESATLMNTLNDRNKELEQQYRTSLYQIEPEFYQLVPNIYEMMIDGTDILKVRECIRMLDKLQKGSADANHIANKLIDKEEESGAPAGLFDFALEGPRIKQGKQVDKVKQGKAGKK